MKRIGFSSPLLLSFLILACLIGSRAFGQYPGSNARPAGVDISGAWHPVPGQDSGIGTAAGYLTDYTGIPLNESARLYALAYDAARIEGRNLQCMGYVPPYAYNAPGNYRFYEVRDPSTQKLVAIDTYWQIAEGTRTIWMDGRPQPPAWAQHTFAGFSTGKYEGDMLSVYTTHLKRGWIRASGVPQSDEATLSDHFIRHGDRITYFSVVNDPVYLAAPFSRIYTFVRDVKEPDAWLYACDDSNEIPGRKPDEVPAFEWGHHPFLLDFSKRFHVPLLGALGGPETIYPEFLAKLKDPAAAEAAARTELTPSGPEHSARATDQMPHDGEIHILPVQGNLYMLVGDGGNIAVQVGDQAPMVVNTGAGQLSDQVIAAIRTLTDKPIQYIVNTGFGADLTGGNLKLHASGHDPSLEGSFFSAQFPGAGNGATIIGQQEVQDHMIALKAPSDALPTYTFLPGRTRKFFNGEAVEIFSEPNAVTDSDSIVHFRKSDVIVTGNIFSTISYPVIDTKNGGSIQGEIRALDDILSRTVYKHDEEDGTMIIPAHGRLCDEFAVAEYRDMLGLIRDRVQKLINSGATLEQVKAARVTADFDNRFGATSGPWTTDMFVEAVYRNLKNPPKPHLDTGL